MYACFSNAQHSEASILWAVSSNLYSGLEFDCQDCYMHMVRIGRMRKPGPRTDDPRRCMPCTFQRTSPLVERWVSNHWRTPFLATSPITRIRSSRDRSRYSRIIQPQTLHKSSHSASNSSHQQFSGADGRAMPRWRVVSKMEAHTMVGTEYNAYTGVCNLAHSEEADSSQRTAEIWRTYASFR